MSTESLDLSPSENLWRGKCKQEDLGPWMMWGDFVLEWSQSFSCSFALYSLILSSILRLFLRLQKALNTSEITVKHLDYSF